MQTRAGPLTVDTMPLPARAVTEVTVYCDDHPGLFSKISGALAVAGASIVDARIHTLTNGMALDTFWIQDAAGGAFNAPHRLAKLAVLIEQALSGRVRLPAEILKVSRMLLGRRTRAINVPPRVVIDNHASNSFTVLEVNGRDRPGLLHDVTAAISQQGMQITSAHVTTYGVRAVDVFYVKDVFGLKVENERKLQQIREALLAAWSTPTKPRLLRCSHASGAAPAVDWKLAGATRRIRAKSYARPGVRPRFFGPSYSRSTCNAGEGRACSKSLTCVATAPRRPLTRASLLILL